MRDLCRDTRPPALHRVAVAFQMQLNLPQSIANRAVARGQTGLKARSAKEGGKPEGRDNWAPRAGQAPFDKPALKPYWGKPTVRNFRGDDGNVGIIRSPVRAIALPDNRHEAENEKFLRERTSDPLGPEFCVGHREVHGEA